MAVVGAYFRTGCISDSVPRRLCKPQKLTWTWYHCHCEQYIVSSHDLNEAREGDTLTWLLESSFTIYLKAYPIGTYLP